MKRLKNVVIVRHRSGEIVTICSDCRRDHFADLEVVSTGQVSAKEPKIQDFESGREYDLAVKRRFYCFDGCGKEFDRGGGNPRHRVTTRPPRASVGNSPS